MATVVATRAQPFEMCAVSVVRTQRVTPHLVRVTFTGPELARMADNGYDQRVKLILAASGGSLDDMPRGDTWFTDWRLLPTQIRPVIRTYTVRFVRPELQELDIDMVDHGDSGPASAFAGSAQSGDQAIVYVPMAAQDSAPGGLEFRTDLAGRTDQLLVGDESALPAICGIVERLPENARGLVCIEVGDPEDFFDLPAPVGVEVTWCVRAQQRGMAQEGVIRQWLDAHPTVGTTAIGDTTVLADGEDSAYWEVTTARGDDVPPLSAWIAGESSVIKAMRRLLVNEYAVPKSAVAFMGYWREGKSEC